MMVEFLLFFHKSNYLLKIRFARASRRDSHLDANDPNHTRKQGHNNVQVIDSIAEEQALRLNTTIHIPKFCNVQMTNIKVGLLINLI